MPHRREILLVNPRGWRLVGDRTLPTGLLSIAAPLRDRFRVRVIDQRVEGGRRSRTMLEEALDARPLCVGVTAMTGRQILDAIAVARAVRARGGTPIVWGGVHASLEPRQTVESPWADHVVQGEGEETFSDLARRLDEGGADEGEIGVAEVRGLWSKRDGDGWTPGRRGPLAAERIPRPAYDLVDLERYVLDGPLGRSLSVFSSRGCPFACSFCYNVAFFQKPCWRPRPTAEIIDEIGDLASRHRLAHVQFLDDNFLADRGRVLGIAEGIGRLPGRITWSVLGGHVRNLVEWDEGELASLVRRGFREILVGAESGSQAVLDRIGKGYRIEELLDVNARLGRVGIRPTYSFMSGLPGEADEDLARTVRLMFRLREDNPRAVLGNIKPYVPYPGTPLFDRLGANGHRPPARLEDWAGHGWHNYENVEIPWVDRRRRRRLSDLYYASLLLSPDYLFVRSSLFRAAARVAGPGARWRIRRLDMRLAAVPRLLRWIQAHIM